jgi:hypothetical protein
MILKEGDYIWIEWNEDINYDILGKRTLFRCSLAIDSLMYCESGSIAAMNVSIDTEEKSYMYSAIYPATDEEVIQWKMEQ